MPELSWDDRAAEALQKVPFFVRPLARRKIEEQVQSQGRTLVTLADFDQAQARFQAVAGGRRQEELSSLMPAANQPGVEMVLLESCRSELTNCPNRLLPVEQWREPLEQWIKQSDLNERLRARVHGDQVLYHHKLKIALAGCPNGCSRPQIADLALVGFVRPQFDYIACTACGACVEACPDQALVLEEDGPPIWDQAACQGCLACSQACPAQCITLSDPAARVLVGGKLGRHPRLAQAVAEVAAPEQAIALFSRTVDDYLADSRPGERLAAWWARTHKGV